LLTNTKDNFLLCYNNTFDVFLAVVNKEHKIGLAILLMRNYSRLNHVDWGKVQECNRDTVVRCEKVRRSTNHNPVIKITLMKNETI